LRIAALCGLGRPIEANNVTAWYRETRGESVPDDENICDSQ
jgi:hypothetical protein